MNFKKTVAIAAAAGALTALAIPAMAEVTPYGSLRLLTGYHTVKAPNKSSDTDLYLKNAASTNFGIFASGGDLGGRVEFGIADPLGGGGQAALNIYSRVMFGTYKMSAGTLLIGQDYTKSWNPSGVVTEDRPSNGGWGNFYAGRLPQVRFETNFGLYAALIQPTTKLADSAQKSYIPKLNVGYDGKAGPVGFGAGVEGQTFKDTTLDKQINSFLAYARASFATGPVALKANIGVGQNLGNAGFTGAGYVRKSLTSNDIENTTRVEGYLQAGFTVSPMLKLVAIVGGANDDNDTWAKSDSQYTVELNAPITVAKNFIITPEIAYFDYLKDNKGDKQNKEYYYGAHWKLNF